MKLFSEKVTPTLTNSSLNIIQVENFHEIFFDVYEIELNKNKYPVEKISSYKGNPVVSIPVVIGESEQEYPFVLMQGSPNILFNEQNTEPPLDLHKESHEASTDVFEVSNLDYDARITESARIEILNQIETAKKQANEHAVNIKRQKLKEADLEIKTKNKLLQESLTSAKQQLVDEFVSITESIKKELLSGVDSRYSEISETVDNKIKYLADNLAESVSSDFENSEQRFETNIKEFVKALHNATVLPELRQSLQDISESVVSRISDIETSLDEKLVDKADLSVIEEISSELSALRDTNLELNNNINKGVNRALSRIGNVTTKIDEVSESLIKQVDDKILTTASEITEYYSEKLKVLEDQTFNLNESSRKYVIELVEESRNNLISEIRKIKKEAPVEYIIETAGKREVKSLDNIEKDINKKISDKIADEVVKLRKYVAVYSSGGGTVAQQFADGGTMNGNLTVTGAISASEYLGISMPSGDYLPLSGGVVNGNVTIYGTLSTTMLEALSANITVLDIKQYELSGFNVTGTATVQGSVSASGVVSASSITETSTASTGTGGLVRANSPTLVTPNIGAATGTSLVITGKTDQVLEIQAGNRSYVFGDGGANALRFGVLSNAFCFWYAAAEQRINGASRITWAPTSADGPADTGISRKTSSPGVLRIGNGTANNDSGSIELANLTASGTVTANTLNLTGPSTSTPIPITHGGTNATTESVARTNLKVPGSVAAGISGASAVTNIIMITPAAYTDLVSSGTVDSTTLYLVTEA